MSFSAPTIVKAQSANGTDVITAVIDTSAISAKLILVFAEWYTGFENAFTDTDDGGSTPDFNTGWSSLSVSDDGVGRHGRWYYKINPTTTTTHQFQMLTYGGTYPSIYVLAFPATGVPMFHAETSSVIGTNSVQPGSQTFDGLFVIRGTIAGVSSSTATINSSFNTFEYFGSDSGNALAGGISYKLVGGPTENPTISWSNGYAATANMVTFSADASPTAPNITGVTATPVHPDPDIDLLLQAVEIAGTNLDATLTTPPRVTFSNPDLTVSGSPTVTATLITLDVNVAAAAASNVGTIIVHSDEADATFPFVVSPSSSGGGYFEMAVQTKIKQVNGTSQSIDFYIPDTSNSGVGLTGLVYNTSGLVAYIRRGYAGPSSAVALASLAGPTSSWTSGGFVQIDATHKKGWYRFDIPNALLASGVSCVYIDFSGALDMPDPVSVEIQLLGYDYNEIPPTVQDVVDAVHQIAPTVGTPAATSLDAVLGTPSVTISDDIATITPSDPAAIRVEMDNNSTKLAAINAKTTNLPTDPADQSLVVSATDAIFNRIGLAGVGLTNVTLNSSYDAAKTAAQDGASVVLSASERTAMADAFLTRTLGTEAYAAVGAVPTVAQLMFMLLSKQFAVSINGTTLAAKRLNGSNAMTFTLNSPTAPTSIVRTT